MQGFDPPDDSVNTDHSRYQTPRRHVSNSPPLDAGRWTPVWRVGKVNHRSYLTTRLLCGSHLFSHGIHTNTKTLPRCRVASWSAPIHIATSFFSRTKTDCHVRREASLSTPSRTMPEAQVHGRRLHQCQARVLPWFSRADGSNR
jgi:hypothetical protein